MTSGLAILPTTGALCQPVPASSWTVSSYRYPCPRRTAAGILMAQASALSELRHEHHAGVALMPGPVSSTRTSRAQARDLAWAALTGLPVAVSSRKVTVRERADL